MKKSVIILLLIILVVFCIIFLRQKSYASKELPKVYITVEDEEAFRNLTKAQGEQLARLEYDNGSDNNFSSYIKIKVQGSTSAQYPKKNYTVKLYEDSEYSKKQKVDMGQGWGDFNKYCLKANWIDDKTHSRNIVTAKIAAKIQKKYGLFNDTPNNGVIDGFPIEIYLNGEFLGLYTWNIPKDAWMWNIDEDNPNHIVMEAGICTDYTYFKEEIASVDALGDDESDANCSGWVVEAGAETQETVDKFNRIISFVKNSTDEEFIKNFENYFNKDAMLNYLTVLYLAEATDNVAKNMMLVTYDGTIWYPTLYDLDTTYGMHHRGLKLHTNYFWIPEDGYEIDTAPHANGSLLLEKVIRCFPDDFAERWFELRKDIISDTEILNEFNNFIGNIPESTLTLEAETWKNSSWNGVKWETIPGFDYNQIKAFLAERLPFVDGIMYSKYTTEPSLSVKYSETNLTNGTVIVTAVANRNDITFGSNPTTYSFNSNGTYTFKATDGGGNDVIATATVDWIDKTAPDIEVTSSKTELTNEDVVVIIKANEKIQEVSGWKLSEDKLTLTKTYTSNVKETVEVYDIAGNKKEVEITIDNIDKTAPDIEVTSSKTELTNEDVVVTIKANEKIQEVSGWKLSEDKLTLTKTYTSNVTETIQVMDLVGNTTDVNIKLINIDKVKPQLKLDYNETDLTNGNVVVIITSNEKIQEVEGWEISEDNKILTKTFEKNEQEKIEVVDMAGNITTIEINVVNIDKVIPKIKVNYSCIEKTNKNVVVTITSDEKIQEVEGWKISEDKKVLTKVYEKNGQEIIRVIDLAGNIIEKTIEISNIDKDKPITEVRYKAQDKCIVAEIISNEKVQEVDGWKVSEDKLILTKTYTSNVTEKVEVYDIVGNSTEVEIIIEGLTIYSDDKDNNTEIDTDKSTTTDMLPNTGKTEIILILILASTSLIGITIFKLNKYKGI